jgi:hypothetical protein
VGAGWFPPFPQESTKTKLTLTLNAAVKVLISLFVGIHIEKKAHLPRWGEVIV